MKAIKIISLVLGGLAGVAMFLFALMGFGMSDAPVDQGNALLTSFGLAVGAQLVVTFLSFIILDVLYRFFK